MDFKGQSALITGAAVGIGRATALRMAEHGASVAIVDRDSEKLSRVAEELTQYGVQVLSFVVDVTDEARVREIVAEVEQTFGHIDVLVNNAALWRDRSWFLDTTIDTWKKYMDINVMGVVYCTRAVLGDMLEAGYGRIVNVASVAGVYGNGKMVHYSATKGALIAMTEALSKEVCDKGVIVNAVSPGTVSPAEVGDYEYVQESAMSYMGRTGSGMENANLICFLASDEVPYLAGQNIQIDGCRKKI